MNYILKYYRRSRYLGFSRLEYKEFNSYSELYNFVDKYQLRSCDYDIYGKVIL